MLLHIILREIKYNILSLRLHITMILTIIIFGFGAIAFVQNYNDNLINYKKDHQKYIDGLREKAENSLTSLAIDQNHISLKPRSNAFISGAKENYTPNRFRYSAYNIYDFSVKHGSINPYLSSFHEMNWTFIIAIIVSFVVLLFTFDSISGEKDANDPDSPHWYNPYEHYSTTRKPVKFDEVPLFDEKSPTIEERFFNGGLYFLMLCVYSVIFLLLTFFRFLKYDVR